MAAVGGADACLQKLGNAILPGYTASKIRALKKTQPVNYAQLDCILLPHDYLNFYLTGERCMEMGDASGTGCLDIRNRTWSEELLIAVDPDRDLRGGHTGRKDLRRPVVDRDRAQREDPDPASRNSDRESLEPTRDRDGEQGIERRDVPGKMLRYDGVEAEDREQKDPEQLP